MVSGMAIILLRHEYVQRCVLKRSRSEVELFLCTAPFDEPSVPTPFRAFVGDENDNRPYVIPSENVPVPNRRCPDWLHDLYVVASGSTSIERRETGEPSYWRTWHPAMDPIYWCKFGHEHGSYPGGYRPMFAYTAWKKKDPTSGTGRQLESHNGFKIFSFVVPRQTGGRNRAVVITLHQHLSTPRRFSTRTHTVVFAVLDMDMDWEVEAQFHFKMDFGPVQVTYYNESTVPFSGRDQQISSEVGEAKVDVGRRFNVLNLTNYPSSVDTKFQLRPDWTDIKTVSEGVYEQWKGSLPTCSMSDTSINYGFLFETRDPATGLRGMNSYEMEGLRGRSVNRLLVLRQALHIRRHHCHFDRKVKEHFYSDVDMQDVRHEYGKHSVRQYMKADFEDLTLPSGRYVYSEQSFTPAMTFKKDGRGRMLTIDGSIDSTEN